MEQDDENTWTLRHGILLAIENAYRYSSESMNDEQLIASINRQLISSFNSNKVFSINQSSVVEVAVSVTNELMNVNQISLELLQALVALCSPGTDFADARREAIIVIKNLTKKNHKLIIPVLKTIIPILMQSVRDRTIPIKLAAERALVYVLQIRKGTNLLDQYLKTLDSASARSIGDYARRVLQKIGERDSDVEDE